MAKKKKSSKPGVYRGTKSKQIAKDVNSREATIALDRAKISCLVLVILYVILLVHKIIAEWLSVPDRIVVLVIALVIFITLSASLFFMMKYLEAIQEDPRKKEAMACAKRMRIYLIMQLVTLMLLIANALIFTYFIVDIMLLAVMLFMLYSMYREIVILEKRTF